MSMDRQGTRRDLAAVNRQRWVVIGLVAAALLCEHAPAAAQTAAPPASAPAAAPSPAGQVAPAAPAPAAAAPAAPAAQPAAAGPTQRPAVPAGFPVDAPAEGPELTLEQAIARALERNEQPKMADERARAAEARVDKARSLFFPTVTASGNYSFRPDPARERRSFMVPGTTEPITTTIEQERHTVSGLVGLNINVLDPRAFPLYSQAKLENAAADLRADEAKRALSFSVARAFIDVLGVEQVRRAAEQRLWLANRIKEGAAGRFEAGLSSSNDVTRADLELASAKRELASAHGNVETARLELGYLIGGPVHERLAPPPAPLSTVALSAPDARGLSRAALARRKDLAAADKQSEALDAAADEPTARWFPRLALVGQYRVTSSEEAFLGQHQDLTAGVQLTWDLWDGGVRIADREERVAIASVSELEAQALARRVGVDVRQALSQLQRGQTELHEAEVAAVAARRNMDETRELYRQGLVQSLSVADAALQLFAAEVELVRARYDIATALLDLRATLGLDPFGKEPR
jgi:outer membrane protein TolC